MPLDFREIIESIAIHSGHLLFTGHRYASEHLFAKLTDKVWYQGHYYFDFTILWLLLSLMNTLHRWTIHMLSSQIPKRSASLIFLSIFLIGLSHFYGIINIPLQLLFCDWLHVFGFVLRFVWSPEMKNLMKFLMSLLDCVFLLLAWKDLPIKINITFWYFLLICTSLLTEFTFVCG